MTVFVDELVLKAMALSSEARALLAEKIVESLGQESICEIWLNEAKKRRDEVQSGRVQAIDGAEAMQSFLPKLWLDEAATRR